MNGAVTYQTRWRRALVEAAWATPDVPRKETAVCCVAKRDDLGRLPVGFCSPECERRP